MSEKATILITDDSLESRMILSEIFKDEFNVLEATNGAEALEILKSTPNIAALLLDIIMPVMTGHELLRIIKKDPVLSEIPVIALSTPDVFDNEVTSLDLGAWDFVPKPYDARVVMSRVKNLISRNELRALIIENARLEEKARHSELLRYRAEHDVLTGMFNAQTFYEKVQLELENNPKGDYSIIRYDINGFKLINDLFGYDVGDLVIKHMADVSPVAFENGCVFGHLQADHFAVLINQKLTDRDESIARFVSLIKEYDIQFDLMPCFGVYLISNKKTPVNLMCDRALLALRTVKGSYAEHIGVYDDRLRQQIIAEQEIVNDMVAALEGGQFELYYQPQYNHDTGKVFGAEALVRWNHPERGLISPGRFIPVFEKNGFISELDRFVWENACKWLHGWLESGGQRISVSVNISRVDIFSQNLYDTLTGLVEKYKLPVELFRLEITESSYVYNAAQLDEIVRRLQNYGFLIEMDDFGSGYSSLNVLKDIPVDILKLDMKFLSDKNDSGRGGSIVNSIVRMAKWLNMPVIAEGVEKKSQADFLQSIGCSQIQGYYYSRPLPQRQFEQLLRLEASNSPAERPEPTNYFENAFWDSDSTVSLLFSKFVDAAGVFEFCDDNLEVLRVNNSYFEEFGIDFNNNEAAKRRTLDAIPEPERSRLIATIRDACAKGMDGAFECTTKLTRIHSTGQDIYVYIRARVIGIKGKRTMLFASLQNVTQQYLDRHKHKRHETRLYNIMSVLSAITVDYDVAADIADCSSYENGKPRQKKVFEHFRSTLKNNDYLHPDSVAEFTKKLESVLQKPGIGEMLITVRIGKGSYHTQTMKYSSIAEDGDSVNRIVAVILIDDILK